MSLTGSCLCGAVGYAIEPPFQHFLHCHCSRCRKATGTAHATNIVVAPGALQWTRGEENLARYDLPTARSFATTFCKTCGSPMPHLTRSGSRVIVPAGSLDSAPDAKPTMHAFWTDRASWFDEGAELPRKDQAAF